jgi:SAM-dependent methyltransferase
MNVSEEDVLCNICGSDDFVLKFIGKDRQYKLPGEFRVVECRTCGLLYINPRPIVKSLAQYYPQIYWGASVSHRPLTRIAKLDAMLDAMLVNAISYHMTVPEVEGGTLLDIGCGEGSYLASMKRAGWDVYGVEPSAVACELARRKWGLEVFNGTIDEASFPDDKFDGITMHHVLEHTDNPSEVLVEIHHLKTRWCARHKRSRR